jgi:O-acetyl-ADP-ribose deacetylase (regulator of RNase III)
MPFGIKKDVDGKDIDFDETYDYIIKKAVAQINGLQCLRCDDIDKPGWIHERMLHHIATAAVAIVDTSTLNANVFYELGVRHALKKGITVLLHREGTTWPFNIAGMDSINYTTNPRGVDQAIKKIVRQITNAMNDQGHQDSLVYHALTDLHPPAQLPRHISKFEVFEFPEGDEAAPYVIGVVTGDLEQIDVGDVWINSENTDMQMDRFSGKSTSATIRYLGAKKHEYSGRVVEDTIAEDLTRKLGGEREVDPATVIPTVAGMLEKNGVKQIFHVASVTGEPREGYRPIERVERCVTRALALADQPTMRDMGLASMLLPILGTGPGGGDLEDHARRLIGAAIDYLDTHPDSMIRKVYFYAWSDLALRTCQAVIQELMANREV